MAKTTDLVEVTNLADGDLGMVVDVSNTSMDATGTNSKVTLANVYAYIKAKTDALYQSILVSGSNIKTIGGVSILGSGDISVGAGDMVLASAQTNSGVKTFLDATLGLRNAANTFTSFFTNANTASRTYTLKDASGTLAFTSDITGTNSGTNTGDQTSIVGITGTMAQFDTAVTDGNFVYQGQALGTPSSGTLTNATGLPVSGITASTVTALGVGSIELGHASDTTIARVSAGVASIEGNNIVVNTSSPTLATITTTGNIELGNASDTTLSRSSAGVIAVEGVVIPSISSTNTLTNKRVTPRTGTTSSSATPTINTDNVDFYSITAQTVDITSFTTNLSGTPTDGQKLWIAITGTAARAITWGSSFESGAATLPTTTVSTTRLDVGFVWNTATSKWRCMAQG